MNASAPSRTRKKPRYWIQVFCLIAFLAASGCYTVLKHPAGVDLTAEEGSYRECTDCHQEGAFHRYDPYTYGDYYAHYPLLWRYYYARPWWYDDYWYYVPDDGGSARGPEREPRPVRRNLWQRGGSSFSIPFIGGSKSSSSSKKVAREEKEKKKSEKKSKDKKKKEEKKRNLWRR